MSAKWRALQHRHRYTYSAVVFPQQFTDSLSQLPSGISTLKFFSDLKDLASLTSTYSQLPHAKSVASSFAALLSTSDDESLISVAARYYLELLFLDNSLPLHRTFASALAKSRNFGSLIGRCFRALCEEYGGLDKGRGRSFCVSRAALSMMSTPKLGYLVDVVDECCILVATDIVFGLSSVITETNSCARPSPLVMEHCQEALSCLYYLLQRFPTRFFADSGEFPISLGGQDFTLFESSLIVILNVLKSSSFSRDCYVAAGVSLCSALQACLSPEELGYLIIGCVFCTSTCNLIGDSKDKFIRALSKVPYQGDLCAELQSFSDLSRLCLIRGILTGLSRTILNTQFVVKTDSHKKSSVQTILYDSILPDLCNYCENPIDSHFNFHALTVMQICLQQIKTSVLADLVDESVTSNLLPEDLRTRIIRIVWNNLEDSLSQTVKQVHLILDLLLDIQSTLYRGDQGERVKQYLHKIAGDLLSLGPRCKGRYIPLASLTRRLGAKTILSMSPKLLFETAHAYIDDDVCCAATSFLKCLLEHLRDEFWSTDGVEHGYEMYRGHCLPPVLCGLASGVPKLRSNLNTYALPCLLEVDGDSIFPMLAYIAVEVGGETGLVYSELSSLNMALRIEQKVAVFVSLLKVTRFLAFFEGDIELCQNTESGKLYEFEKAYALLYIKNIKVKVPVEWLVLALTHVDESLRVDAAESLFLNPKTASLPSHLEIALMRKAVPLNMRCSSTAFQMKWSSLFKKIFSRVRTALERQMKQGIWQPGSSCNSNQYALSNGHAEDLFNRAQELYGFMMWLSCFLFLSCYPSAPYERKTMAMELIMIMTKTWSIVPPVSGKLGSPSQEHLYPYNRSLILPDSTLLLVGSLIDSWDRLRESAFHILLNYPTPLPGISSGDMVSQVISWAKKLVCSPRVRESDAGALTLRLMFRKYVVELGWTLRASASIACFNSELLNLGQKMLVSNYPVVEYLKSLIDWLRDVVEEGERDLLQACQNSFVHGVLLALRYTFEELDWNSDVALACVPEMRTELGNLLELVMRITSLALWVVSSDAWYIPEDMDDDPDDTSFMMDLPDDGDKEGLSKVVEIADSKSLQNVRPSDQTVMVGCWLAMKEVSLLLGTIIRKIPLPSTTPTDSKVPSDVTDASDDMVLNFKQLEDIGDHFMKVLLKMKHNGAIDKTRAGFTALCNRLLCSNDPRLTESWMEQLMERTIAKGQTVDDLLRRSAGIPAAFSAFFLSEPDGAPKKLLPRALRWLIDVAGGSLLAHTESNSMYDEIHMIPLEILNQKNDLGSPVGNEVNVMASKMRDEGVIPMVHAFNVLRAAFNDTNLATDASGFSAEAMIVSIRSFSSPHWEVRNSACLAYTALVRRMVGFLNVQKRESARRAITGLEFFHRYPALHSFIFNELKIATGLLGDERSQSNLANVVHPSLCPILILLSRLKPSPISCETGDVLDPFLLMPFIQRCSTQSNLRIRVLASRALIGLVSNEKLHSVIMKVASELPCLGNQMDAAPSTINLLKLSGKAGRISLNSIHGVLLQLGALLDTNCRSLDDVSTRAAILENLVSLLVKCSWIGNPRTCPCPTLNTSFLWVLDYMLSIARTWPISQNYDLVCGLLSELSSLCLSMEVVDRSSFYDPTVEELRKQAAISYFSCIYQSFDESTEDSRLGPCEASSPVNMVGRKLETKKGSTGAEERLVLCMSDASYEVRLATLKWLFHFLKVTKTDDLGKAQGKYEMGTVYLWAKANLHTTSMKLLSWETHHKCVYYILRILFLWNVLQIQKMSDNGDVDGSYIGDMDFPSVLELWNKLIFMYDTVSHAKTKEALICCLGLCVKHLTTLFRDTLFSDCRKHPKEPATCALLQECISRFVCLIKQHSDASESVTIRKAAAESMVSSGLLEQAQFIDSSVFPSQIPSRDFQSKESVETFAYQILDIWFTCIKLLEDEDDDLRRNLALSIQKCFPNGFRTASQSGFVPAQVEKVMELCLEFLSSTFGNWVVYFDYLLTRVFDSASCCVSEGDLVRVVFDKEIDNFHEEKLLICQQCCSHMEKLPVLNLYKCNGSSRDEFVMFLQAWRQRFHDQLTSFTNEHVQKLGKAHWVGGVGNHKDAFLPLYANLLGIFVLSKCLFALQVDSGKDALVEVVNLGNVIKPFLRNPLIFNLYALVIKMHKEAVGASTDDLMLELDGGDGLWDGFDQYFLLK
ncbi:hypothetical protein V2J09_003372 [Rumex salicifolius]